MVLALPAWNLVSFLTSSGRLANSIVSVIGSDPSITAKSSPSRGSVDTKEPSSEGNSVSCAGSISDTTSALFAASGRKPGFPIISSCCSTGPSMGSSAKLIKSPETNTISSPLASASFKPASRSSIELYITVLPSIKYSNILI